MVSTRILGRRNGAFHTFSLFLTAFRMVLPHDPGAGAGTASPQAFKLPDSFSTRMQPVKATADVPPGTWIFPLRQEEAGEELEARPEQRFASRSFAARTLKCHRAIPGHAIAAVRELKSSVWATAGGNGG